MKIRAKLILANVFIVLLLLGSLTYILMKRSSDLVYSHVIENTSLSLSQVASNMNNKLQTYEDLVSSIVINNTIDIVLDQSYLDFAHSYEEYVDKFVPFIEPISGVIPIRRIIIYTDNPQFTFASVLLIDEDIRALPRYQKALTSQVGGYWSGPYLDSIDSREVFSMNKRLNHYDPSSTKVLSMEIDIKELYTLIDKESISKRFIFTLPDGTVLLDSSKMESDTSLPNMPFGETVMANHSGNLAYEDGEDNYQIVYTTLQGRNIVRGMKVIAFIPDDELTLNASQLRNLSVMLFLGAFLLSVILISLISVRLTKRLTEMSMKMKNMHRDNFQSFIEVKGKDEVAQLGSVFNTMVRRLGQLITEVYQSEIDRKEQDLRTKEVELYALQTQINPHFLFNVLNMIRGKLIIVGEKDTAKVVGLLAKSFRMMLKSGGPMISLSREIEFVSIYLQIQQYRFSDRFTFSIDIPEELMNFSIPKLCIQPLVENSITHGIELKKEQTHIRVSGRREGNYLLLIVSDNGLGIPSARKLEIEQWLLEEDSLSRDSNIGIRNVHKRLQHLYGQQYGLRIQSEIDVCTEVTLVLPWTDIREESDNV